MESHWFYAGMFMLVLIALAFIVPSNTITGLSVQECEGCGLLCDDESECSEGLSCCETAWEMGVCHTSSSCPSVFESSQKVDMESFENPNRPRAINNIAWQTFGIPLLVVILTVVIATIITRKTGIKK